MKEKKVTKYTGQSTPITCSKTSSVSNTALQLWSINQWLQKTDLRHNLSYRRISKHTTGTARGRHLAVKLHLFNECNFCYNEAHTILWERRQENTNFKIPISHGCHLPVGNVQEPLNPCNARTTALPLSSASASWEPAWKTKVLHRPWTRRVSESRHVPASRNFSPHGAFLTSPRPYNPGAGNATEGGGRKIRPRKTGIQDSCSGGGQPLTHTDEKPRLS